MVGNTERISRAKILVVDDSDFERLLISTALKKAGFSKIYVAGDGIEAIEKTMDLRPDIVLLDLKMPKMDGFGYCENVRATASLPRMPIIVQTVLEERESRLRALSCGADDYLIKPLDMEELVLRMRIHIERHFMFRELEDMFSYLKMETEAVKDFQTDIYAEDLPELHKGRFDKHCQVLEQLACLSKPS